MQSLPFPVGSYEGQSLGATSGEMRVVIYVQGWDFSSRARDLTIRLRTNGPFPLPPTPFPPSCHELQKWEGWNSVLSGETWRGLLCFQPNEVGWVPIS